MTQIGFYLLSETATDNLLSICCKLIQKAYNQNHFIVLHTQNAEQSELFDELIWQFNSASFIPHLNLDNDKPTDNNYDYPLLISSSKELSVNINEKNKTELLINLNPEIPLFFSRFHRLIEIVSAAEEDKVLSRQHYKFYKEHGYPLSTHNIEQ